MRPVRRGPSPQAQDFDDYKDAKPDLVSRMGLYCSYCERRIVTLLAVEHIQPKGLAAYEHLAGRWENFLLACTNCNSTETDKDLILQDVLLPDRDNTFVAFRYLPDGQLEPSPGLNPGLKTSAEATLSLVGLDKPVSWTRDENGNQVALDRVSQRMEAWLAAQDSKSDIDANPGVVALRDAVVRIAKATGFFSIWMTVFDGDVDMRRRLVQAFEGTEDSECFDPATLDPVSPAPNPDGLAGGGKI